MRICGRRLGGGAVSPTIRWRVRSRYHSTRKIQTVQKSRSRALSSGRMIEHGTFKAGETLGDIHQGIVRVGVHLRQG